MQVFRYDGRCVWCNPTEIARRCEQQRLRKLLVTELRKLSSLQPRAYDAALARVPEEWRAHFQAQRENAGQMAPGTPPAPPPPAPVEPRGYRRFKVVIEDKEDSHSSTPTPSQHASQAAASQLARDSQRLDSKTDSQRARPDS